MDHDDPRVSDPVILTIDDIGAWFDAMHEAGILFHPDDIFQDFTPSFGAEVADRMDAAMDRVWELCNAAGLDPSALANESWDRHNKREKG